MLFVLFSSQEHEKIFSLLDPEFVIEMQGVSEII